jgi:hypothetical protein
MLEAYTSAYIRNFLLVLFYKETRSPAGRYYTAP